jgi:ADP-dependent NAD(P)H-hydrate dehydratase
VNHTSGWTYEPIDPTSPSLPPLPAPTATSSKHDRGTVVIVAGGPGCPGAAILTATAALRGGAGRVQIVTHDSHAVAVGVAVPETLVLGCESRGPSWGLPETALGAIRSADVVLIGPGLTHEGPPLADLVLATAAPAAAIVFDAAALTDLADKPRRDRRVLLPNQHEVPMVLDSVDVPGPQAPATARAAEHLADKTNSIVVVRGPTSVIADPSTRSARVLDDPRAGLGVAGSGDVLAGIVAAYCARTPDLAAAAAWAVFVHHVAGSKLEDRFGPVGFLARDISDAIVQLS